MALDSWMYQNPMYVVMSQQSARARKEKACGDCKHHLVLELKEVEHRCAMRKRYGIRCECYEKGVS